MRLIFLTGLLVLSFVFSQKSNGQACLTDYRFRRPIDVVNTNATVLNSFQVKVTLNTQALIASGKMRIDGGDVRFTNGVGTQLSYWYDPATLNTTTTEYWVKVDNLIASGTTTIYLFYGNSSVGPAASGDATFELFDDFLGTSLDIAKWTRCGNVANVTVNSGNILLNTTGSTGTNMDGIIKSNTTFPSVVIIEADIVSVSQGKGIIGLVTSADEGYGTSYEFVTGSDLMKLSRVTNDAVNCQNLTNVSTPNTAVSTTGLWSFSWFKADSLGLTWNNGTLSAKYLDNFHAGFFATAKQAIIGTHINAATTNGSILIDWTRVRKYVARDPATTILGEQEFPVNPNPLNDGPYCAGATINLTSTSYTGVNYVWKNPLGTTIATTTNHSIPAAVPGNTGNYTIEISVPGCPPFTATTYVDVSTASAPGTTSGSTTVCSGANAGNVSVAGFTGNIIRWEMANNLGGPWYTVSSTAATISYANLLQTTYFRPVVKTASCAEAIGSPATITVDSPTIAGFVIGGVSVCSGTNSGTLNLVFHQGNVNKWQQSLDGTVWTDIVSNSTSQTFTNLTQTTWYRAEIQSGTCSALFSASAIVTVNPLPAPNFTVPAVCEGLPSNFTNSTTIASGSINNYQWDFGNSGSSISAAPIYTYPVPGTYFVGLTAVSSAGCSATFNSLVTVHPNPNVNFTSTSVCLGSPTTFQAVVSVPSGGTVASYFWDHDDATTSTAPLHNHTFLSSGFYDVLLSVTTNNGCIDSLRTTIEVAAPVNVDFIADSVCLGSSITFLNTSTTTSPSVAYTWDFGNGDNSTLNSPIYSYPAIGTYTVTLQAQVIGSPSSCVSSTQRTVVIYEVPSTDFSLLNVCLLDSAEFSNLTLYTGNPLNISYLWSFGDASSSTQINPYHTYGSPGNFNVTLTANTIEGCSESITKLISVYPMPVSNFAFADVCDDDNMVFTSTSTISSGTITHAWDFGDASVSAVQNPLHLYNTDGTYSVELIVTSNQNCRDTVVKTVVVHPKPFVDYLNTPVCDGVPSSFTEQTTIATGSVVSFDWDFGDGSSSTSAATTHQYLNPGTYNVILSAISDQGCIHDTLKVVTVDPLPVANFTAVDACWQAPNVFTNSSTIASLSPLTYSWNFGDAQTSTVTSPTHIYIAPGLYSVTLYTTSGAGCMDSIVKVTEVYPLPTVNAGNDTTISRGDEVQLNGYDPAGALYSWTPVASLSNSAIPNPIARPMDSTTYTLTLTDSYGCQNSDDMTITVLNDFKLLIHNVITPDGNGQNDFWYITNIDFYPEAKVQIFNRWGEMVYETLAYQNDWNGVFGTDQLPDGTYYYAVSLPDSESHYQGAITLLRNKE